MGVLGLIALAFSVLHLVKFVGGETQEWSATLDAASNLTTIAGVGIGGWWALRTIRLQRIEERRMDVAHAIHTWRRRNGNAVLRVGVTLKNIGLVTLHPTLAETAIHCPPEGPLNSSLQPAEYWRELGKACHPIETDKLELEPGESETYWHDFELPPGVDVIQVHSNITCDGRDRKYWDETSLISALEAAKVN
jgi:hypothetical protein